MLFGLLCLTFAISHVMPGDPARLAAGPDANQSMVDTLRAKYGLDRRLGLTAAPPAPITHLLFVDALLRGEWRTLGDALAHAVLPVVTLCFPALASILRVNRAEMLETLGQDYIKTARAQGFSGFRVVTRYALRNAMIPTLTMIGPRYGWVLGGTILVAPVSDWPGIGL